MKPVSVRQPSEQIQAPALKRQSLTHGFGLLLSICIYAFFVRFYFLFPSTVEDSYIVFRYASHFAAGHGLSWNVGLPHDQGMTGLAWSLIIGTAERVTGKDPAILAGYLGIFFGSVTILVLYTAITRLLPAGKRLLGLVGAFALAFTPIFQRHSANGLETVLAFLAFSLTIYLATILPTSSLRKAVAVTTLACGVAYLIRPDAPAFTLSVLCAAIFIDTRKISWVAVAALASIAFVGLETAVMRSYFTTALPLPFYLKISFAELLHSHSLLQKIILWVLSFQVGFFSAITIWLGFVLLAAVKGRALPPRAQAILYGAIVFYLYLFTVLPVMNFEMRYQSPLLVPSICVGTVAIGLLVEPFESLTRNQRISFIGLCCVVVLATFGEASTLKSAVVELHNDHLVVGAVGKVLRQFPDVKIASTEAGMLAYDSDDRFFDLVGLNNTFVALNHNRPNYGALLENDLASDFGYPDVYVRKATETANYADLCNYPSILAKYSYLGTLKDAPKYSLYLLRSSPQSNELQIALARFSVSASPSDPCR